MPLLIGVSILNSSFQPHPYHPATTALPCLASWRGKRERREKQKNTPASSRIKEILSEAILEVAMVMDNSDPGVQEPLV